MLHIFLGLGPSLSIRSQSPIVRRGNGWGSTPSFFLAGLAALPWGLLRPMSPLSSYPRLGVGVFYGSPTLGTTRDLVHVPTSVRSPICECRAYCAPSPAHAAEWRPPGEDPSGTHNGRRACVVLGTASEPRIYIRPSRNQGPEPNPLVPPGRVAASARQI